MSGLACQPRHQRTDSRPTHPPPTAAGRHRDFEVDSGIERRSLHASRGHPGRVARAQRWPLIRRRQGRGSPSPAPRVNTPRGRSRLLRIRRFRVCRRHRAKFGSHIGADIERLNPAHGITWSRSAAEHSAIVTGLPRADVVVSGTYPRATFEACRSGAHMRSFSMVLPVPASRRWRRRSSSAWVIFGFISVSTNS